MTKRQIGEKVTLKGGHPWTGHSGVVISVTPSGVIHVRLDGAHEPDVMAFEGEIQ